MLCCATCVLTPLILNEYCIVVVLNVFIGILSCGKWILMFPRFTIHRSLHGVHVRCMLRRCMNDEGSSRCKSCYNKRSCSPSIFAHFTTSTQWTESDGITYAAAMVTEGCGEDSSKAPLVYSNNDVTVASASAAEMWRGCTSSCVGLLVIAVVGGRHQQSAKCFTTLPDIPVSHGE